MTGSRHMACRTCRERKVRCDGAQPSCETCKRHGEKCVYIRSAKQTKTDLLEKIENLQERLARAEAQLNSQTPVGSPSLSQCYALPFDPTPPLSSSETSRSPYSHMHMHAAGPTASSGPEIPLADSLLGDGWLASDSNGFNGLNPVANTMGTSAGSVEAAPPSMPWAMEISPLADDPVIAEAIDASSSFATPLDTRPPSPLLPSLRSIRAMNAQPPPPGSDGCAVLRELIRFVSSTLPDRFYIAGMTTAVAEYLAWARRNPDVNVTQFLETLEARLRETANLANTKHWAEFQTLKAALSKVDAYKWKMGLLEHELQMVEAGISEFFSTSYDIHSALALQRRS
ncbi:hypothetical protein BJX61DRAFT_96202 [Aspergillus egyptiacus]|nr:hypothetical protein BJX61DRAFT_96202 [Aspergillus egyptiacus]